MSLPLVVRRMARTELTMVLANWKHELDAERHRRAWGRGVCNRDFWCLVNYVLDRITVPSCEILVGCHEDDPQTPVCWAALRRLRGLSTNEVVYIYARQGVREDAELNEALEATLLENIGDEYQLVSRERPRTFNPFLELRR